MSNGLTFEILNIILRIFYRCWDLNKKWPLQNFKEIGSELTEKSPKIMRSWLIRRRVYSSSQLPPALGVFRRFLTQFVINLHEVLQALFPTIPAPTQKN